MVNPEFSIFSAIKDWVYNNLEFITSVIVPVFTLLSVIAKKINDKIVSIEDKTLEHVQEIEDNNKEVQKEIDDLKEELHETRLEIKNLEMLLRLDMTKMFYNHFSSKGVANNNSNNNSNSNNQSKKRKIHKNNINNNKKDIEEIE